MERRYFELERGYLNIDENGLAFTRSGNWQHATEAPERSKLQRPRRQVSQVIGSLLILVGGILSGLFESQHAEVSIPLAVGLIGLGIYRFYRIFRHDMAPEFRIPFRNLRSVEAKEGRLTVFFVNGDLEEDRFSVTAPLAAISAVEMAFTDSRR